MSFKKPVFFNKTILAFAVTAAVPATALAHHGFGLFQLGTVKEWSGTITKMDFVNPHSYIYFDSVDENGEVLSMKCEMRAASLLRRSGWSKEMFEVGLPVHIEGNPHRDDIHACYTENITIGDRPTINRNDQFTIEETIDNSDRPMRLASGELNISGDWAIEQLVLTIGPEGGNGSMVPKSLREEYASGRMTLEDIRARNPRPSQIEYTRAGQQAADAFNGRSPEDNPWFACKPTSIIRDWTADWPVNRFEQKVVDGESVIDIDYGLYGFNRRIHMGMENHPANVTPSYSGHSIGHWEGDVLVVDTIGFEAGVLSPPTRSSEQMHIVERFTLNTGDMTLRREWTVEDPVYLAAPWTGSDIMMLSDIPFEKEECKELTPEFMQ